MEFQFNKSTCRCLRTAAGNVQSKEETQEIRLSDSFPDIGRVLGCWGQILIRGKEWHTDNMRVSGGVMAWVAYSPEDGSGIRSVETWIPFQLKWDLPDTQRDGSICVMPLLKSIDARSTSARKLMVRACVSMKGEALESTDAEICNPENMPEDIQLLSRTYPVELPEEAGEKLFQLEETLELPGNLPAVEKIIRYELTPSVIEQKVMAGRLVFRGIAALHMLYTGADGALNTWQQDIPFSQYTDLDNDYGPNATAWVLPILTSLELSKTEEGKLELNAGIAAQYVIYDRLLLDIVEDAYSTQRKVSIQKQELSLPIKLDMRSVDAHVSQSIPVTGQRIADVSWCMDHPDLMQLQDSAEISANGQFQVLYYDDEGNLQSAAGKASAQMNMLSDAGNVLSIYPYLSEKANAVVAGESLEAACALGADVTVFSAQALCMVTGLEVGEVIEPDPERPSLVLRRTNGERLWDIAKRHNSTVAAIKNANGLQDEPDADKMLLIPVS